MNLPAGLLIRGTIVPMPVKAVNAGKGRYERG